MELAWQLFFGAAVVVLASGAAWWLKRAGAWRLARPSRARRLELLERLALSPHHTLCLVRSGEVELLVALYPGGCALLDTSGAKRPAAAAHGAGL